MIDRKTAVQNILAVYNQATQGEIDHGMNWYSMAAEDCRDMAREHNVPFEVAAATVAALSPNNRWERNLWDASLLLGAYMAGESMESVKVCTYHAMRAKAWAIINYGSNLAWLEELEAEDIAVLKAILKGQKVVCFFENIIGENTCTIDGHARNIAYGERLSLSGSKFTIGKREYAYLQSCYAEAASALGHNGLGCPKAYELQAITWVTWRRIHDV